MLCWARARRNKVRLVSIPLSILPFLEELCLLLCYFLRDVMAVSVFSTSPNKLDGLDSVTLISSVNEYGVIKEHRKESHGHKQKLTLRYWKLSVSICVISQRQP